MAQKYFKANLPKLENLRIARGWSREQLASKAILSTRTLDSIMSGKSAVLSTFSKLAKVLETPVNAIVDGFELPQHPRERRWTVTISISAPYDAYDETKDLPDFLKKLLNKVGGDEIWGVEASAGSTKIEFYLTDEQYAKLMSEYEAGNLDDLNITNITSQYYDGEKSCSNDAFNLWYGLERRHRRSQSDTEDKGEAKTG